MPSSSWPSWWKWVLKEHQSCLHAQGKLRWGSSVQHILSECLLCFWHPHPTKFIKFPDILRMQILVWIYVPPLPHIFLSIALLSLKSILEWESIAAEAAIFKKVLLPGVRNLSLKHLQMKFFLPILRWSQNKWSLFMLFELPALWVSQTSLPNSDSSC